ncbi:hypothetical protein [Vibrio aphrogenes]|uniref:hypothetical protein n=1 Tax=Vibrio aphrogenes TaxID=1891186 RepID=UPI000B35CA1A
MKNKALLELGDTPKMTTKSPINRSLTRPLAAKSKQSGSVLMVVIFVIVVMGLLASTMARLEWSNQDTQTREIMGNRAWFISHSINEWALTQLYPLQQTATTAELTTRCESLTKDKADAVYNALYQSDASYKSCSIKAFTCTPYVINEEGGTEEYSFMKVHTNATCSDGQDLFSIERAQDVVVKALQ